MKKNSLEILDDGFVNIYEEWLFVRCFEYSAVLMSEITWYRLFANIDKKTGFVFLECGFPKDKLDEIIWSLENRWYYIRFIEKTWNINTTFWNFKLEKTKEKLIEIKNNLIKF